MTSSSSARRRLLCGPEDTSVLYLHRQHVSNNIWEGVLTEDVSCRRYKGIIWYVPIHPRVLAVIDEMGFGGILRCGQPKDIDHHLIIVLIERWRPETHTFHFPVGEATMTLEDVEVLWGLKVDGDALTGYLGFIPDAVDLKEMVWKQTSLSNQLKIELSDVHHQYIYVQRARVYCLLLLGGLMILNASGNKIPLFYLQFFMDVERCASYSWGGATLACLYHNLCEAALARRIDVGGALTLLHLWAWERIPNIRPHMVNRFHRTDFVKQDRRGKSSQNWVEYYANHKQDWDNRHNMVWTDVEYSTKPIATDEYMDWFRRITEVYLTKPGVHAQEGFHETTSSHSYAVN
ncbi:protein MAIN-LIKE 1-like [Salvia splendens]|uniref:protein MAIN-LIKE 1-like n=1 Tax=Salvia splendens TaxID=180675 RepID=UPI001C26AF25|nr:protein MAIN-LIKE 1-like [Salvia splendens]